jgi:uncharacterized protein YjbJ (UPF0337 family)
VTKGSGTAFSLFSGGSEETRSRLRRLERPAPTLLDTSFVCSPRSTIQHFNSLTCSVFQMQASGAWMHQQTTKGDQMKDSTKDQLQGKVHEAKGKIKEKAGILTNNPNLQAEGQDEKLGGKIQKKIGQVEKVLEK